jgi:PPOX class probable F420-dependent enzyme
MIGTPEQNAFIDRSYVAIVSTVRIDGTASTSMVFYGRIGDRLLFSTERNRVKGRHIDRDPRVTLTVTNTNEPNSYLSVQGHVTVHLDNPAALREQIYRTWDGVTLLHPASIWHNGGRETCEPLFTMPGRAIYEVTPVRVSGELLDAPVLAVAGV